VCVSIGDLCVTFSTVNDYMLIKTSTLPPTHTHVRCSHTHIIQEIHTLYLKRDRWKNVTFFLSPEYFSAVFNSGNPFFECVSYIYIFI